MIEIIKRGALSSVKTRSTPALECWFTNIEQTPLNRNQQLSAPYKRLIDEIKQN